MSIFLVCGESGKDEFRQQWVVRAFTKDEEAQQFISNLMGLAGPIRQELQTYERPIWAPQLTEQQATTWYAIKCYLEETMQSFDPDFQSQDGTFNYWILKIPLDTSLELNG